LYPHDHIDALSFYIYDAGFVLATSIGRQPFGKGTPDRGQSLLFYEFMQSWLGYELVKVLIAFGLQPTTLNTSLERWLLDLYHLFTYLVKGKKPDMAKTQIEW
jgi:hypothetical protein